MSKTMENVCDACGKSEFQFLFHHHHDWQVKRCKACGLAQIIPRPSRKEVAALYHEDMEHFEPYIEQLSVHQAYFRGKVKEMREHALSIRNQVSRKRYIPPDTLTHTPTHRLRLLDVGCAMGVMIEEAKRQGMAAEGLDISHDAVSYCTKRGMKVYHGTIIEYAKKNPHKKYDIITAFETIEHEYSPKRMIEAIYSMLNSRGIAVLTTPNYGSMWRRVMGKYWPGYQHPEHLFFFDDQSLFNLCMNVGFTTVTVRRDDNRPFPLSFLFTRAADYFPVAAPVLKTIGNSIKSLPLINPINPWDDILVIAHK